MTGADSGLGAEEAARLALWLPRPVPLLGAGLGPQALLDRLEGLGRAEGQGLVLAVIPSDSLLAPDDPARLPDLRRVNGAALAWLVRAAAPALAPRWRLNGVTGLEGAAEASARAVLDWLLGAESVTGQVIRLDGAPPPRGPRPRPT